MPNSKQASKRNRQRDKRRIHNRLVIGGMRASVKAARTAIQEGAANAADLIKVATSAIDSAVSKGSLKRKTASRYISRLITRRAS